MKTIRSAIGMRAGPGDPAARRPAARRSAARRRPGRVAIAALLAGVALAVPAVASPLTPTERTARELAILRDQLPVPTRDPRLDEADRLLHDPQLARGNGPLHGAIVDLHLLRRQWAEGTDLLERHRLERSADGTGNGGGGGRTATPR